MQKWKIITPAPNKNNIFEPRIELGTFSVLDWRDNQLHHPNIDTFLCLKEDGRGGEKKQNIGWAPYIAQKHC